jgi:hypothetical protein
MDAMENVCVLNEYLCLKREKEIELAPRFINKEAMDSLTFWEIEEFMRLYIERDMESYVETGITSLLTNGTECGRLRSLEEIQDDEMVVTEDDISGEKGRTIKTMPSALNRNNPNWFFEHLDNVRKRNFGNEGGEPAIHEITDTEGDLRGVYAALLMTGAARRPNLDAGESEFLYFYRNPDPQVANRWLAKEEIMGLDREDRDFVVVIPNLIQNENYNGQFFHKGDYLDRGEFSLASLLLLTAVQLERDERGNVAYGENNRPIVLPNNKIHVCNGNHETTVGPEDFCINHSVVQQIMAECIVNGTVGSGFIAQTNSAEHPFLISHTALTTPDIGCLISYLGIAAGVCDYFDVNDNPDEQRKLGSAHKPTAPGVLFKKINEQGIVEDLIKLFIALRDNGDLSEELKKEFGEKLEKLQKINLLEEKEKLKSIFNAFEILIFLENSNVLFKKIDGKYSVDQVKNFFEGLEIKNEFFSLVPPYILQKLKIAVGNALMVENIEGGQYKGDDSDDCLLRETSLERGEGKVNCIFWADLKLLSKDYLAYTRPAQEEEEDMAQNNKPRKVFLHGNEFFGNASVGHQNSSLRVRVIKDEDGESKIIGGDVCSRMNGVISVIKRQGNSVSAVTVSPHGKQCSIQPPIIMQMEPKKSEEKKRDNFLSNKTNNSSVSEDGKRVEKDATANVNTNTNINTNVNNSRVIDEAIGDVGRLEESSKKTMSCDIGNL